MNEEELKKYLIEFVIEYGTQWNVIESDIYNQRKMEDSNNSESNSAERINWFERLSIMISPLFDTYCTDKKRVYGGKNRRSFGYPVKYSGIEEPVEADVIFKNKYRAEVYIKTNTNFYSDYLFILLKKGGQWKIDSYKERWHGYAEWDNQIL